ncbi:DUF4255 domain-containing protein [Xanthomarina gelatinilytica]|uniref:DUF4255 domain-containing protein n=1 Tax=Xanthomarina gelatinilytica TaxID=1137281 RepID=UPI003AA92C18
MINTAIQFITSFLNNEIQLAHGVDGNMVVAGSIMNTDGSVSAGFDNKMVLTLINLEQEKAMKNTGDLSIVGRGFGKVAPPIYLNMYLLVSANFVSTNYMEALKMLSTVIGAFQVNSFFSNQTHPDLDSKLGKLTFEIVNLSTSELSHVWSGMGAKYLPSVLYKVRMITFNAEQIVKEVPEVSGVGSDMN